MEFLELNLGQKKRLFQTTKFHIFRLLLLRVNYIQLQRKSNNFHGLTIKTKRILGLKIGQIQVHIIMTCACFGKILVKKVFLVCYKKTYHHYHQYDFDLRSSQERLQQKVTQSKR